MPSCQAFMYVSLRRVWRAWRIVTGRVRRSCASYPLCVGSVVYAVACRDTSLCLSFGYASTLYLWRVMAPCVPSGVSVAWVCRAPLPGYALARRPAPRPSGLRAAVSRRSISSGAGVSCVGAPMRGACHRLGRLALYIVGPLWRRSVGVLGPPTTGARRGALYPLARSRLGMG